MDATIGKGLGKILFGMREPDLIEALGPADKAYDDDMGRYLQYDALRCTLWLDPEQDGRLHWIVCSHPDLTLLGQRLMGRPRDEVLEHVAAQLPESIALEDHGMFESHTFEDSWVELEFAYGVLREVSFGHLFDEADEPIWAYP